jgi:hypothetical protein
MPRVDEHVGGPVLAGALVSARASVSPAGSLAIEAKQRAGPASTPGLLRRVQPRGRVKSDAGA